MAPANSSYVKRQNLNIIPLLENDITAYCKMGDIMILGNTNARMLMRYLKTLLDD